MVEISDCFLLDISLMVDTEDSFRGGFNMAPAAPLGPGTGEHWLQSPTRDTAMSGTEGLTEEAQDSTALAFFLYKEKKHTYVSDIYHIGLPYLE